MKKKLLLLSISLLALSITTNCAKTVTDQNQNTVLRFIFKVRGTLAISNDITYYLVLNAPNNTTTYDPNIGPRINGPDLIKGSNLLEGRIPFTGKLVGDLDSVWTDFFYFTGVDGKMIVGRGRKDSTGNPIIYDRNYLNPNTKPYIENNKVKGFQLEFFLTSLNGLKDSKASPKKITANLAVSQNIDKGSGEVYDSWNNNTAFDIDLSSEAQDTKVDARTDLVLRKLPLRPAPVLPLGINSDDINLIEYTLRIAK
ncbi:MAG: hypothetical protein U0354_02350 [Candidatus Sericytochromatia bacterium]